MSGFDLSTAAPVVEREDEGQVVHLRDEMGELMYYGESEPVTITVVGTYSSRYRRANDEQMRRLRSRRTMPEPEENRRNLIALHAACVLEWAGFFEAGEPLDCTKENVRRAFELASWIHEQVVIAMEDHAGFSVNSSSA